MRNIIPSQVFNSATMALEKNVFHGGLITTPKDNYSIIHTRLVKNKKKKKNCWCLRKKRGFMGYYDSFYW